MGSEMFDSRWEDFGDHNTTMDCHYDPVTININLKNSVPFPDEKFRQKYVDSTELIVIVTADEAIEAIKHFSLSVDDEYLLRFGPTIKDSVVSANIIRKLGGMGVRATAFRNSAGTLCYKLNGYAGLRQLLKAPVFSATNAKLVEVGIGSLGRSKAFRAGARFCFFACAAVRTLDYILNDETSLAEFLGPLATDVVKIGITTAVTSVIVTAVAAGTSLVVVPIAIGVFVGFAIGELLSYLDDEFGITTKLCELLESGFQTAADWAVRAYDETTEIFVDIGAMYQDGMLELNRTFLIREIKQYYRNRSEELTKLEVPWEEKYLMP